MRDTTPHQTPPDLFARIIHPFVFAVVFVFVKQNPCAQESYPSGARVPGARFTARTSQSSQARNWLAPWQGYM